MISSSSFTPIRPFRCGLLAAGLVLAMSWSEPSRAETFTSDLAFLQAHTDVVLLQNGEAKLAVVPAWQGRVMTSSAGGSADLSYGWINRQYIASRERSSQFNPFGGEERFWLGPEGGQYSVYFAPGKSFDLANWQVPPAIDTLPFEVISRRADRVDFKASFALRNYSGHDRSVGVERSVALLPAEKGWGLIKQDPVPGVTMVAYESTNSLSNRDSQPWTRETGLLSIWILGMYSAAPDATIILPYKAGEEAELGPVVTSDYFGSVPSDRLSVGPTAIFMKADGNYRSKLGMNPKRSKGLAASYDADKKSLTIVQFDQPAGATEYVNSAWRIQDKPYEGDVINAYNDGAPKPGAPQLGKFYELESSSPAAALAPGQAITHIHRTLHLSGDRAALNRIARTVLGTDLDQLPFKP